MTTHRTARTRILLAAACIALAAGSVAGCSGDDETTEPGDTTTTEATSTTEAPDESGAEEEAEEEAGEEAFETTEVGTNELLDFLNGEDPALGGLFDWNTGDGVIAINYLGTQTVQLYAAEIDEPTALEACELAATYVFEVDEEAAIEVRAGTYPDGEVVVTATGPEGPCAAA